MQLPIQLQFSSVSSLRYTLQVGVSVIAITDTQLYRLEIFSKTGTELFGGVAHTALATDVDGVLGCDFSTTATAMASCPLCAAPRRSVDVVDASLVLFQG